MTTTLILQLFLLLILRLRYAEAGEVKWGSCPSVNVIKEFDYSQMVGTWYVIEKTKIMSTCMTYEFITKPDDSKSVRESARPFGINIKPINKFLTQEGSLRVPSPGWPAKMRVVFPISYIPYTEVDYWVMDTDYQNYAAIWSCRSLLFAHRQIAMILSRKNVIDRDIRNKIRDKFESFGVHKHELSIVDQKNCDYSTANNSIIQLTTTTTTPRK